jgi:hypothetical protein
MQRTKLLLNDEFIEIWTDSLEEEKIECLNILIPSTGVIHAFTNVSIDLCNIDTKELTNKIKTILMFL